MSESGSVEAAERLVGAYLSSHAANDLEGVLQLFEEEACVEDPVGSPVHSGLPAIRAFYAATHRANGTIAIERVGPLLVAGTECALHVRARLEAKGSPPAMDVIYVIRIGASGRIAGLRAWF